MKKSPSVKLEVDPSIIERNLIFTDRSSSPTDDSFDPISKLLGQPNDKKNPDEVPWKYVRPSAGFCVKTRTLEGDKVFINICYTDEIPSPREISDEELIQILESEEASNYTVPLSLGDLHIEADKSGNSCSVYDVAISTSFYNKILKNQLFKTFLMTVVMEGIESKFKLT
uniref:PIH1 domain-containing protein 1 n=1 Tax=Lygus hesperus TaxID=30085 RepID=A0A0A9WZ62_LYGHE